MYTATNVATKSLNTLQASLKRSSALQAGIAVLMLSPLTAYALPTGGTVAGGTFTNFNGNPTGANATITQTTNRGVLNWNQFNINNGESVTFNQTAGNRAITLNRVTNDVNPSQILGSLHANGNVIVSNPNGVVFGANARVDVAGLIATTANANTADFMSGGNVVLNDAGSNAGTVTVNHGAQITTTADNGLVALVATNVDSEGQIYASKGNVVLAGAQRATFDLNGDGLLSFAGASGQVNGHVYHNGSIQAQNGNVVLTAVEAKQVVNGAISPSGDEAVAITANGQILGNSNYPASVNVAGRVSADGNSALGLTGGTVTLRAQNVTVAGTGYVPFSTADAAETGGVVTTNGSSTTSAGRVFIQADNAFGQANLKKGSSVSADGASGGTVAVSGQDVLISGNISASPHTATGALGEITVQSQKNVAINAGNGDDVQSHVAEEAISNASSNGTNFTLIAPNITMFSLTGNSLTGDTLGGGNGSITFKTNAAGGNIAFQNSLDAIHTTTGNITFNADNAINIGSLSTGLYNFDGLTLGQPTGAIKAGNITLTSGGDINNQNLSIKGTDNVSGVTINAGGNYKGNSIYVNISDLPDPGGEGNGFVNITAAGDIEELASTQAYGIDQQGATQAGRASIRMVSTGGSIDIGDVIAQSKAGAPQSAGLDDFSQATVFLSGNTVDLHGATIAQAIGSSNPTGLLTINANHLITAGDVRAEGASVNDASGTGIGNTAGSGNVIINAPVIDATVNAQDIEYLASTDLKVNGAINVNTPAQANLGPNGDEVQSTFNLDLYAGRSVNVTGNITSPLVNIRAEAGSGGIQLADVTTGDRALIDSETQFDTAENPGGGSQFGSFIAGNIFLETTNGGNINAGNLATSATESNVFIRVNSAGTLNLASASNYLYDKPDHGSVGTGEITLQSAGNLTVTGDVTNFGFDTQGQGQGATLVTNITSGDTLTIGGDLTSDATGGIRGLPGDTGATNSSVVLTATNAIDVNGVEATANGGTSATAFVFLNAPTGTLSLGNVSATALTSTPELAILPGATNVALLQRQAIANSGNSNAIVPSGAPTPVDGQANATVHLLANGSPEPINSDANITYKANDPFALANDAFRQGRFTDAQTVGGDTARLIIIDPRPVTPTPPANPTPTPTPTPTPEPTPTPATTPTPTPTANTTTPTTTTAPTVVTTTPTAGAVAQTQALIGNATPQGTPFPSVYSYYGETTGDRFYFGNTDVNLTLLGSNRAAPAGLNLANLAPAAGGQQTGSSETDGLTALDTEDNSPIKRKVGGSDAKLARYTWFKETGKAAPESPANNLLAGVQTGSPSNGTNLANLAPAAGGNGAALAQLEPAAGGAPSCGNNFLDAGYDASFNRTTCRNGQGF